MYTVIQHNLSLTVKAIISSDRSGKINRGWWQSDSKIVRSSKVATASCLDKVVSTIATEKRISRMYYNITLLQLLIIGNKIILYQ